LFVKGSMHQWTRHTLCISPSNTPPYKPAYTPSNTHFTRSMAFV